MKNLLMLICILFPLFVNSQIKIGNKTTITPNKYEKYDSTYNYPKDNIYALIGQDLYIKPLNDNLKKFGYRHFYEDYNTEKIYDKNPFGSSKYDNLEGQTFKLNNIIAVDNKKKYNSYSITGLDKNKLYYFQLTKDDNILYFLYTPYESSYPFISLGYFEKIKKENINKKFYYKSRNNNITHDYKTGKEIELKPLELWTCVDVILNPTSYEIELVFSNGVNQIDEYYKHCSYFMKPKELCDLYKEQFGDNFSLAMNNKICVGMEDVLVLLAWGNPDKINSDSFGTYQWVYKDQYVYIEDGKVKAFN